jgi:hypothetical protein
MESPAQTSFIPHDAGTPVSMRRESGGLSELFLLVSILLLIVSGALGAGVFLYTQYLQTSAKSKLDQLNRAEAAFDPSLVQQLTRLDSRMRDAQSILSSHLAPSQFFSMLESSTIQDISFSTLTYDASDPTHIELKMSGIAGSVNSIALQAQLFSQGGIITSPIFSNIDREQDGVHFDFSALVNPAAISYESLVSGNSSNTSARTPAQTVPAASQTQASPFGSQNAASSSAPAQTGAGL